MRAAKNELGPRYCKSLTNTSKETKVMQNDTVRDAEDGQGRNLSHHLRVLIFFLQTRLNSRQLEDP